MNKRQRKKKFKKLYSKLRTFRKSKNIYLTFNAPVISIELGGRVLGNRGYVPRIQINWQPADETTLIKVKSNGESTVHKTVNKIALKPGRIIKAETPKTNE